MSKKKQTGNDGVKVEAPLTAVNNETPKPQVPQLPAGPKMTLNYINANNQLTQFFQMGKWNWDVKGDMAVLSNGEIEIVMPVGRVVNIVVER